MIQKFLSPLHKTLFIILALMLSVAYGVGVYTDLPDDEQIIRLVRIPFMIFLAGLVLTAMAVYKIICNEDPVPFGRQILERLPTYAMLYVIICLFCSLKSQIGILHPFDMDPFWMHMDRILCFGRLPQQWLAGIYDSGKALMLIDHFYFEWFFVIYIYASFCVFVMEDGQGRFVFVVAFALVWFVIGNIFATLFSSVGPVFLTYYYPDITSPYTGYVQAMDRVGGLYPHMFAHYFREMILNYQIDNFRVDENGPSAAPSVHAAMAALMFFHSRKYFRIWSYAAFAYLLIMMAGAVILCWHYISEVCLSVTLTYLLWRGVERLYNLFLQLEARKA